MHSEGIATNISECSFATLKDYNERSPLEIRTLSRFGERKTTYNAAKRYSISVQSPLARASWYVNCNSPIGQVRTTSPKS